MRRPHDVESDPFDADPRMQLQARMDVAKNRDVRLPLCTLDKLLAMARSLDQTEAPLMRRLHIADDDGGEGSSGDADCA